MMRAVKVIVLLAILQGVLAGGLWWLSDEWLSPKRVALDLHAPATVVERLADLYAAAAVRFVLTADHTALAHLVRRAATWPEVVYVGVEDARGKVLAHTDPARVGKIRSLAILNGGSIAVESQPGNGVVFTLTVPMDVVHAG
ncbi:MAG: hypothetical protein ACRDHY_03200 [Anaerolineales bacterium]